MINDVRFWAERIEISDKLGRPVHICVAASVTCHHNMTRFQVANRNEYWQPGVQTHGNNMTQKLLKFAHSFWKVEIYTDKMEDM